MFSLNSFFGPKQAQANAHISPAKAAAAEMNLSKGVDYAIAPQLGRNVYLQSLSQSLSIREAENAKQIKYILLKLNQLLNDIDYIINIKNKLIKIFKVTNIKNLGALNSNVAHLKNLENNNNSLDLLVSLAEGTATDEALMKYLKTLLLNYSTTAGKAIAIATRDNFSPACFSCRHACESDNTSPNVLSLTSGENLSLATNLDKSSLIRARLPEVFTENQIKIKETIKSITNNVSISIAQREKSNLSNLSSNSQPIIGLRTVPTIRLCNTSLLNQALALTENDGTLALALPINNSKDKAGLLAKPQLSL